MDENESPMSPSLLGSQDATQCESPPPVLRKNRKRAVVVDEDEEDDEQE